MTVFRPTRLGVDKVKSKGWFKFFLTDKYFLLSVHFCGTPPSWLKVIDGVEAIKLRAGAQLDLDLHSQHIIHCKIIMTQLQG